MLLWQDLPLQWGYARSVRKQAVRQARKAVEILGHHPSVAIWCGHNEPLASTCRPGPAGRPAVPAPDGGSRPWRGHGAADLEQDRARPLDQAGHREGGRLPPGHRPHRRVAPPPRLDGTDSHLYFGWYHGDERDLPGFAATLPRMVRFVSRVRRPGRARDRRLLRAGALARPRLGAPGGATTACSGRSSTAGCPRPTTPRSTSWRAATQAYQATVMRHHVEALRRLKYRPDGRLRPVPAHRRPARGDLVGARPRPGAQGRATRRSPRPAAR